MTALELANQVRDAFNRHGKFTTRLLPTRLAEKSVEVRYADTGDVAATIWTPFKVGREVKWMWLGGQPGYGCRYLPESATVEELVRAVATHVLDEIPTPASAPEPLAYTDAHIVAAIEDMLDGERTDFMLGCRVRLLMEQRADWLRAQREAVAT